MRQPQFSLYEFVDNNIFNVAMGQLLGNDQLIAANGTFIKAGLINPNLIILTRTTGSMVLTVDCGSGGADIRFLFKSGAHTAAHGTVDGADTQIYTVDFTSFIPGSGSVIVYLIASYVQIQQDAYIIVGPPPGHPDYSSTFIPYQAYSALRDSVNITATLTPPDNLVNLEIARFTLSVGQTQLGGPNLTHQVLAQVNIASVPMSGDITGTSITSSISFLQGKPVSTAGVLTNQVLSYNGVGWVPATVTIPSSLPPTGPAGGDLVARTIPFAPQVLTSNYPSPVVTGILGFPILSAPATGQYLGFTGSGWGPAFLPTHALPTGPAGGDLADSFPFPTVVKIQHQPVAVTTPTEAQVLEFTSGIWTPITPAKPIQNQAVTTLTGSDIPLPGGTARSILPVGPITIPAGTWRLIVFTAIKLSMNSAGIRYQINSYIIDDQIPTTFCTAWTSFENIAAAPFFSGVNASDISPLYTGPISVNLTLWMSGATSGKVVAAYDTRVTWVLVPAAS